jgi:hypothetical protein
LLVVVSEPLAVARLDGLDHVAVFLRADGCDQLLLGKFGIAGLEDDILFASLIASFDLDVFARIFRDDSI